VNTQEIIDRLKQTTIDLLWVSESDYPFQIVVWSDKAIDSRLFPTCPNEDIQVISLDDFFAPALRVEDWYEEEELATVDRYKLLLQTIDSSLSEIRVFRLGEIEVDVYIVGKTPDGDVIGLQTTIVET
jgi:Nuclease A inhibitor-like protein